jgi:hypothetical protein
MKGVSFQNLDVMHKSMQYYMAKKPGPHLMWAIARSLETNMVGKLHYEKYTPILVETLKGKATAVEAMSGLQYIGRFGNNIYKPLGDKTFARVYRYLDKNYARVMESGAVKKADLSSYDINQMQAMLHLTANYSAFHPNYWGLK